MKNNTQVETAQKSQATNKNISKVPTGKVTLMKETEARKKAREEQYRNFRIGALKRRCKRAGISEEDTKKYIEKLKKQLDSPKEYSILIMFNSNDGKMFKEALAKANINYKYHGDIYFSIDGNQTVLAKIREIAPPGSVIHPYAKKMESVLPKLEYKKSKKPTNNTANAKKKVKDERKTFNKKVRAIHKKNGGKTVAKMLKRKTLLERKKQRKATTVQLKGKKPSEGSKTLNKAA